jgi:hypothetical protein
MSPSFSDFYGGDMLFSLGEGMRLHGPENRFELDILSGPDSEGWCKIRVTITQPGVHHTATASCLRGIEIRRLSEWLERIADGSPIGEIIEFMEPELSFALLPGDPQCIRVFLRWNLRPNWLDKGEEFFQDYPAEPGQLRRAAASLRTWFERKGQKAD